ITPPPADGDTGIEKIADIVVRDLIITAVSDPHSNGTGKDMPTASDDVVIDRHTPRARGVACGHGGFTDPHAARAEIFNQAMLDAAILTATPQPDAVDPYV